MALYSFNVSIVSGGSERGAVSASSYQSGQKMKDKQRNQTYNYEHKERIIYTNLLTPENAPEFAKNREQLWNAVEQNEKTGRYARLYKIALPNELTEEQQIALADDIASYYRDKGMCVDYAVHRDADMSKPAEKRNPHMHMMATARAFTEDGDWAQKFKNVTVRDKNGKAICIGKDKHGRKRYKHRKVELQDWGKKDELIRQRRMVAGKTNAALAKAGFSSRVDHRSNIDRGINKMPTIHLGAKSAALEKKGIHTERGNHNRAVTALNAELKNAAARIDNYDMKIERIEKNEQRKQRNNEIARRRSRNRRRKQAAYSKQSFAARKIGMYYMQKRLVDAYSGHSRSFAASQHDMFMLSKRQRASLVSRRSGQDRDTRLPKLQLLSWGNLNRNERRVLLNELKKDSNWVFSTDAAKYNMSQHTMFVRNNGGRLAMYPLGSGVSRYKPGDIITARDMQTDCRAAYVNSSAGRDAGRALKSAVNGVCDFFDPQKRPKDHLKSAVKNVKDAVQAPVKIAKDLITNPIAGLLKAPLRAASAASSAASAATHTVAAAVKTGIKAGGKANTTAGGGGFTNQHGSKDDDWNDLLTDADKAERREKQLYRI